MRELTTCNECCALYRVGIPPNPISPAVWAFPFPSRHREGAWEEDPELRRGKRRSAEEGHSYDFQINEAEVTPNRSIMWTKQREDASGEIHLHQRLLFLVVSL